MRTSAVLLVLAIASGAGAEAGGWRSDGPEGGAIYAVTFDPSDPNVLYGASREGAVFRSGDGGVTWGLAGAVVYRQESYHREGPRCLAVDPVESATIWAGTATGLFRSDDRGASWAAVTEGIGEVAVNTIVFDPSDRRIIYAGTGGIPFGNGLFKSTDGGSTWRGSTAGLMSGSYVLAVLSVVVDPRSPSTIYLGTLDGRGVFKSVDGGATFAPRNSGLGFDASGAVLAADPAHPDTLYAATRVGGVFKTTDGAETWMRLTEGYSRHARALFVDASSSPPTLYEELDISILRSMDEGSSWQSAGPPGSQYLVSTAFDPRGGPKLVAGTFDVVFRSNDGGRSWAHTYSGVVAEDVNDLATFATDPLRVLAATPRGLLESLDGGASWNPTSFQGEARVVTVDPTNEDVLYASGNPQPIGPNSGYSGLFKSTDAGRTWLRTVAGLPDPYLVTSIAVAAADPSVVYASTFEEESCDAWLSRSTDSGLSWQTPAQHGCGQLNVLGVDASSTSRLWISIPGYKRGLLRSTDGGTTWVTKLGSNALPLGVSSLAMDEDGLRLWAGTTAGVYRSSDGGETWALVNDGLPASPTVAAIAADPRCSSIVYAAVSTTGPQDEIFDDGVFRSTDGGDSWQAWSDGLVNRHVVRFAFSGRVGRTILAATLGGAVARRGAPAVPCRVADRPKHGPDRQPKFPSLNVR